MYDIKLQTSWFPVQNDAEIRDISIGELLREIAATYPDAIALQQIDDEGKNARILTYAALLAESEKLAQVLASRFTHGEKIVVWAPNQFCSEDTSTLASGGILSIDRLRENAEICLARAVY